MKTLNELEAENTALRSALRRSKEAMETVEKQVDIRWLPAWKIDQLRAALVAAKAALLQPLAPAQSGATITSFDDQRPLPAADLADMREAGVLAAPR